MAKTNRVLIRTLCVTIILRNIILIVIEQVGKLSYNIVACVPCVITVICDNKSILS